MNPLSFRPWITATLLLTGLPAFAQTIPNPGFELDTFGNFPGYVSGNAPITGWTGLYAGSHGINPGGGSPFADNGTIPEGSQVGFVQNNNFDSSMETTISGLTPGQTYQLAFRANARNGNQPVLNLLVDGNSLVTGKVFSVGAANPYRRISAYFTASASTAALTVQNTAGSDNTLLIDDFSITSTTSPWSSTPWTDVDSTGIDSAHLYSHAYSFGSASSFVLNAVPFTGIGGGNPAVAGKLVTSGFDGVFTNDGNALIDGSRPLANDFVYNGFPGSVTLSGLTPGKAYKLSLFTVGWEAAGERQATFRSGTQQLTIDQNFNGNNNGNRIDYTYVADGTGSVNVRTHPLAGNSFHLYGIANQETVPPVSPVITINPKRSLGLVGQDVILTASAAGAAPLTFKWFRNGTEIAGETTNTLTVSVTSAATQSGNYTFRATNGSGSATSTPGFLEVYQTIPNGLYGTGVDPDGMPLDTGSLDPHYILQTNPDNEGVTDALVQDGGAFPIVSGPWLANSATSVWIGPRVNTSGAAGPDPTIYLYRTTFDLTGKGTSAIISGSYASDNNGTVLINGTPAPGVATATNFGVPQPFVVLTGNLPSGTVTSGVNNLDFQVINAGGGYTGLRVDGLSISQVPAGIAPAFITQPTGGLVVTGTSVTLTSEAYGTADLAYQWAKGGTNLPGETNPTLTIGSFGSSNNGNYTVKVTNPVTNITSNIATLTASNVPPTITTGPLSQDVITGSSVTLSYTGEGSLPLSYQWNDANGPIAGATSATYTINPVTHAASSEYTVKVTNDYGNITSGPAKLSVYDPLPGVFNTGVDDTGTVLADGDFDSHYTLVINPGQTNEVPAVVHDSTIFPIVNGPWLANTASSKWISPIANSASAGGLAFDGGAGPGTYVYRVTTDLSAFYLPSVRIKAAWAVDNTGLDILVNGTSTGLVNNRSFAEYTPFTLIAPNAAWVQSFNTIDFVMQNADGNAGYTGLRVNNVTAYGILLPPLPPLTITLNGNGQPVVSFTGVAGTSYPIQRSTDLQTDWSVLTNIVAGAGGAVSYTDTAAPPGRAFYRTAVQVPAP